MMEGLGFFGEPFWITVVFIVLFSITAATYTLWYFRKEFDGWHLFPSFLAAIAGALLGTLWPIVLAGGIPLGIAFIIVKYFVPE